MRRPRPPGMPRPSRYTGTRYTHRTIYMPYRDPEQRAAWMREYRKRKRLGKMSTSTSVPSTSSDIPASVGSRAFQQQVASSASQPLVPNTGLVRKSTRASFRTAPELARTFPFGVLASQACPYCYNTGYSSPGTRCSYCQSRERWDRAPRPLTSTRLRSGDSIN